VIEKLQAVKDRRDGKAVSKSLEKLEKAAARDSENLLPYLIECCHAYVTVGEMVVTLKKQWGEFEEPIRL